MNCNCCPYMHKTTAISATGTLTVTNDVNIGNFDRFCLCITINPSNIITTAPVALSVQLNGTEVPLIDEWGYPVTSDNVITRKRYVGRYITTGGSSHVTLLNANCVTQSGTTTVTTGG